MVTALQTRDFVELEGKCVGVALVGGERLDDAHLVSGPRHGADTLWVYTGGEDLFLPRAHVLDIWPM